MPEVTAEQPVGRAVHRLVVSRNETVVSQVLQVLLEEQLRHLATQATQAPRLVSQKYPVEQSLVELQARPLIPLHLAVLLSQLSFSRARFEPQYTLPELQLRDLH